MEAWRPGPKTFSLALGAMVLLGILVQAMRAPVRVIRSIHGVAVSPSGRWVAGGTQDGVIRVWDAASGTPVQRLEIAGVLNDLRFSRVDGQLAVANHDITLIEWRTPDRRRVVRDDGANYGVVRFGADERSLLTINGKGEILMVDLRSGEAQRVYCCSSIWGDVEFASGDGRVVWAGHWPGVWDLRLNALEGRLTESRQFMAFGPVAVDAAGGRVFMGSQDGRVHGWDLASRRLLRHSPPLAGYVRWMALLGGWLAYAGDGGPVRLWHVETGEHRVVVGAVPTSNLVMSGSGNRVVFGTAAGRVELWDLLGGRRWSVLE